MWLHLGRSVVSFGPEPPHHHPHLREKGWVSGCVRGWVRGGGLEGVLEGGLEDVLKGGLKGDKSDVNGGLKGDKSDVNGGLVVVSKS